MRLITSRFPTWQKLAGRANCLALGMFAPSESLDFLRKCTGRPPDEHAAALAEALDHLPLALEHAAAYIESRDKSYEAYLNLFTRQRQGLWGRAEPRHDYEKTIATTWTLAFDDAVAALRRYSLVSLDVDCIDIHRQV